MDILELTDIIKRREGLGRKPYTCPSGKLTIGWGHNLESSELPLTICEGLLQIDLGIAERGVALAVSNFYQQTKGRQYALIDMAFNMGVASFLTFRKMLQAIADGDWNKAADEATDSNYYRQHETLGSHRAEQNIKWIREG